MDQAQPLLFPKLPLRQRCGYVVLALVILQAVGMALQTVWIGHLHKEVTRLETQSAHPAPVALLGVGVYTRSEVDALVSTRANETELQQLNVAVASLNAAVANYNNQIAQLQNWQSETVLNATIAQLVSTSAIRLSTCGAFGRYGPTQSLCDAVYMERILVEVNAGYQSVNLSAGHYLIEAAGAKGGNHASAFGGGGAISEASFHFELDTQLVIVVGQPGWDNVNGRNADEGGSGGGGTFVTKVISGGTDHIHNKNIQLLLAAGGGAGVKDTVNVRQAEGGLAGEGNPLTAASGGKAGAGGGFRLDAQGWATTAKSFLNGATGGKHKLYSGGFGGGGAPFNGAGGGGGYDGGDCNIGGSDAGCHGGTSFGGKVTVPNANLGPGYVRIKRITV